MVNSYDVQTFLYTVFNNRLGNFMSPQMVMVGAAIIAPYVTDYTNTALQRVNDLVYYVQTCIIQNPGNLYACTFNHSAIITVNGISAVNLSFNSVNTPLGDGYRKTLDVNQGNLIAFIGFTPDSVCVYVPFCGKPLMALYGRTVSKNNITMLTQSTYCMVTDLNRKIIYTFNYINGITTSFAYSDMTNGYQVTCDTTPNSAQITSR